MNKNILVTGSNGQLGSEIRFLHKSYEQDLYKFHFTDVSELDITDIKAINDFVVENNIKVILNCAAYTAVDKAEDETELADKINHLAVKNLVEVSSKFNCLLVHISTDFVFDGTNSIPYIEEDIVGPISIYGSTKLAAEAEIIENASNAIIIRTSWVYSTFGANFVKTIQRLAKERDSLGIIFDQIGSPTYARDLARVMLKFIGLKQINTCELYHYSNEGIASWYDFAKAIAEFSGIKCDIQPIETTQYPTPAERPKYSVMNKGKIKKHLNISIPHWRESLHEMLKELD